MAEKANEKAEWQDNPGGIPQCYAMGHYSSGKEADPYLVSDEPILNARH